MRRACVLVLAGGLLTAQAGLAQPPSESPAPAAPPATSGEPAPGDTPASSEPNAAPAAEPDRTPPPPSAEDELRYGWEMESDGSQTPVDPVIPPLPVVTQVPEQPAPPPVAPGVVRHLDRRSRWLNLGSDLAQRVAQDGGFALRPRWGGLADDVIARGAAAPFGGNLSVSLDGAPLGVPLASRGMSYTDLRLIPTGALAGYRIDGGAAFGTTGASVGLQTRTLHGAEGGLLIGAQDQRGIALAGGATFEKGNALIAFESRTRRGPAPRTNSDLMSLLAHAGLQVNPEFGVGVNLRYYRGVWDEQGALQRTPLACPAGSDNEFCGSEFDYDRGRTDGGDLRGNGLDLQFNWQPLESTRVTAAFGLLEDRFDLFQTVDGLQTEHRDYNRVLNAHAEASFAPGWCFLDELALGGDFTFDNAVAVQFATEARERLFRSRNLRGDWYKGGVYARATSTFWDSLRVSLSGGLDTVTLRRTEPRLGAEAHTQSTLYPVFQAEIGWETESWGVRARVARDNGAHSAAFTGGLDSGLGGLAVSAAPGFEVERAEIVGFAQLVLSDWVIGGSLSGYGGTLGNPLFALQNSNTPALPLEAYVVGGDLALDVEHTPTRLVLVARGGPSLTSDGERFGAVVPGAPLFALHVGVLRRVEEGLVAEAWFSAYGDYAQSTDPSARLGEGQQDLSVRVGYRFNPVSLWLGVENLLDGEIASSSDPLVRRNGRSVFGMLEIAP